MLFGAEKMAARGVCDSYKEAILVCCLKIIITVLDPGNPNSVLKKKKEVVRFCF